MLSLSTFLLRTSESYPMLLCHCTCLLPIVRNEACIVTHTYAFPTCLLMLWLQREIRAHPSSRMAPRHLRSGNFWWWRTHVDGGGGGSNKGFCAKNNAASNKQVINRHGYFVIVQLKPSIETANSPWGQLRANYIQRDDSRRTTTHQSFTSAQLRT